MGANLWPVAADLCTLKPRSHALAAATCRTGHLRIGCSWLFGGGASLCTPRAAQRTSDFLLPAQRTLLLYCLEDSRAGL